MFKITGIPTDEMIMNIFPELARINKGPVAIIECFQNIPCNPCTTACRRNAIADMEDLNELPILNTDICNGCGICISKCPGLAIMVVDGSFSDSEALFKIPYEFLPLPKEGDVVEGLDRAGEHLTFVKVIKVVNSKSFDKTPVIHVSVNKEFLYEFRNIRLGDI